MSVIDEFARSLARPLGIFRILDKLENLERSHSSMRSQYERDFNLLRKDIMTVIEELSSLKSAIADLTSGVAAEKLEVGTKLGALEAKIAELEAAIGNSGIPADLAAQLAEIAGSVRSQTEEIKSIVSTPVDTVTEETSEVVGEIVADPGNPLTPDEAAVVVPAPSVE